MQQTVSEFWMEANQFRGQISEAVKHQTKQPKNGGNCYIASVRNRYRGTEGGRVSEASIKLAGQRLAEGTHELATDDQIEAFVEQQLAQGILIDALETARKTHRMAMVDARFTNPAELGKLAAAAEQASKLPPSEGPKLKSK
jgi:hypothetical protein